MEQLTYIRRSAILQRFEPLTYPVMVRLPVEMNPIEACAAASLLICRYANVVVLNEFNEALLSTLFTLLPEYLYKPAKATAGRSQGL